MNDAPAARYPAAAMILHWLIAIAVIVQWRIAEAGHHAADEQAGRAIMANHFALGIVMLLLVLARFAVRAVKPNPPLASHLAGWERALAKITHTLFYVLLIAMPLAGWYAMSKYGAPIDVWGLFSVPALPVAMDPEGAKEILELHGTAGTVLLILTAIHALGALKHTFLDKDGNLWRMLPFGTPKA